MGWFTVGLGWVLGWLTVAAGCGLGSGLGVGKGGDPTLGGGGTWGLEHIYIYIIFYCTSAQPHAMMRLLLARLTCCTIVGFQIPSAGSYSTAL